MGWSLSPKQQGAWWGSILQPESITRSWHYSKDTMSRPRRIQDMHSVWVEAEETATSIVVFIICVVIFYEVTMNTELMNTKPLLLDS